jgi:cell wall-associated NlpC family hydrolase
LWGGTSTKGFDCSGFVQTVFYMNNVFLPRDVSQMILEGEQIESSDDLSNLIPGDLLFFGSNPNRATHVGIYLGNQQFIHSDGWVHINSLNPDAENYNDYRKRTFQAVRRYDLN